ncbi:MAG TPA: hypothetical protein VK658_17245 [Chryseolinea sp.]|nr:hypothetical protein [Chryseolinea sp.]
MRAYSPITALAIFLMLCSCRGDRYSPANELDEDEQTRLIRQMVYYSTKLPPNAGDYDKFDEKYDWYYDRAAAESTLLKFYKAPEQSVWYFMMSRMARSVTPMQEGIAGKVKLNADGSLADYEEVFRVWKMPEDTLKVRSAMLFDRMVRGKDLSLFYPKYQGDKFIELPTDGYYFDQVTKRWKSTLSSP